MRMEKDATKKRKLEERKRKGKLAAEVLSNTKAKQPKLRSRCGRVIRPPEQSYEPANKRRTKPKVMCDILLRSHATNESATNIHFILRI